MRTARALILSVVFVAFEFVAFNRPPVTWLRWDLAHPDTCCLRTTQIVLGQIGLSITVLLAHGAVLLVLNEIVRFVVLVGATLTGSPGAFTDYYLRSDY
jgi:hypothetical protein